MNFKNYPQYNPNNHMLLKYNQNIYALNEMLKKGTNNKKKI
jgi:hypothetical protein